MKTSTIWLLLLVVLASLLLAWEQLDHDLFVAYLPFLGLVLVIFVVLLFVMPESRNSFRVVFALRAAHRAMQQGYYDAADLALRRALALAERTGRVSDQNLGQVLYHLAELHRLLGRYGESELLYHQALRHLGEAFKPTHPFRIYAQHNLGVVYILQGRFADAEPICAAALDLMIGKFGIAHPHPAVARCNLGKCYQGQGRFGEAEALYGQVLKQLAVNRRPDERMTHCVCLHHLAELFLEQNRLTEVEPLLQQSLAELDRGPLADRQEATRLLHTQAEFARQQGRLEEAEELCQRFLKQIKEAFPPQHPIQAEGWLTQARLRVAKGDLMAAAVLYQQCWTVWEPLLAPEHTRRAQCCHEFAEVLRRLGREPAAARLTALSQETPVWVRAADSSVPHAPAKN